MKFDEIFEEYKHEMTTLSICKAADMDVLKPVLRLFKETNMRFHLVDDKSRLEEMLETLDEELIDGNRMIVHHSATDEEAATIAVGLAAEGKADILMKGLISTSTILKEVLNKSHGLIQDRILSHVALFDLPNYHKAVLLSDAAMNIAPDAEQKTAIIRNAAETGHKLGMERPKVALLAAVEKVNRKISSTIDAETIIEADGLADLDISIDGPLQYDLAISKESAEHKNLESEVAGDADILIAHNIDAGNVLYKALVYSANARVASVITGASLPIVLTSRADSAEDKYNSIRLAMKISQN
ncbi:phosphate acyltransferase [Salinicoccus halodurans]|uniref:Phosphate butyryltransferase n=1 Tax=Salinicoccus halodurans TaxID=407035 RepID=A0A0F7D4D4_9STAP|nr:phosphate acyltransferase [Salinicoccus halodurans]AKG74040.1 phosphate butyryltransferase [Salinicoccus halodurans]SFK59533.1 phosphate butyryltransferase [Salinicoccus halodurans]